MFKSKLGAWTFCVMVWGALAFGGVLVVGTVPEIAFSAWAAMAVGAAGALVVVGETR